MSTPAIIVDVDGTLADCTHRLHHVKGSNRNWGKFFDEMSLDEPILPIIWLTTTFFMAGHPVVLCSGRPETHRQQTEEWLLKHHVPYDVLYMRPDGDYRKDSIVKKEMLYKIRADGVYDIQFCVDDRPSVIQAWREEGLICLACKPEDADAAISPLRAPKLEILVGPSGAGKSTFAIGRKYSTVISTDQLRAEFCGDFRDQTRNDEVFKAYHAQIRARLWSGLDVVADATHIRRKDRLEVVALAPPNAEILYHVINRPMEEKYTSAGWRAELPIDLIAKHEQTFQSQIKDILSGDKNPRVQVVDHRRRSK